MTTHSYSKNNSDKSSHSSARPFFNKGKTVEPDAEPFFNPSISPDTAFLQAKCMHCQTEERIDRQVSNEVVPEEDSLEKERIQAKAEKQISPNSPDDTTDNSTADTIQNETTATQPSMHASHGTVQAKPELHARQTNISKTPSIKSNPLIQRMPETEQVELQIDEEESIQAKVEKQISPNSPDDTTDNPTADTIQNETTATQPSMHASHGTVQAKPELHARQTNTIKATSSKPISQIKRLPTTRTHIQTKPEDEKAENRESLQRHSDQGATDNRLRIQPRLKIGPVDDPFEREADRMADAVVATRGMDGYFGQSKAENVTTVAPAQGATLAIPAPSVVQRECTVPEDPEEQELLEIQGRFETDSPSPPLDFEQRIRTSRGEGHSLPDTTRSFMESRIGSDFSNVRIHHDAHADALTRDVHAEAFTVGSDLFFSSGTYRPGTHDGDQLLAHELTHVVQQSGQTNRGPQPAATIQRSRTSYDRPRYYRHIISGQNAHYLIEQRLLDLNSNLVVEAPIPGANRNSPGFNKVGFADLYWALPDGKFSGIRGVREGTQERDVHNMDNCGSRNLRNTRPCYRHNARPARRRGQRGWNPPHLPSRVELGEIKPATRFHVGGGMFQLSNYRIGLNQFADAVRAFEPSTPSSINVRQINVTIPDDLDYRNFREQRRRSGGLILGNRRMWIYGGGGLFVYFDLAADLMRTTLPREVRQAITAVEQLREGLTQREAGVPRKARPVPVPDNTAATSSSPHVNEHKANDATPEVNLTTEPFVIQRRRPRAGRGSVDRRRQRWLDDQRDLKHSFLGWLRRGRGRDLREKLAIDHQLGVGREMATRRSNEEVRQLQSLLFWSGRKGRFVGRTRFLLGGHFERLQRYFDRTRQRTRRMRSSFRSIRGGSGRGWRARLGRLIIEVAREAIGTFITELFSLVAGCAEAAMDQAVDRFQEEISEEHAEELCRIQEFFEDVRDELETLWEPYLDDVESWVDTLNDFQWWLNLALTLEGALRLAFQAVSCLSPPALGCLWGLVGQLVFEVVLDLIVGTQQFHDHVVDPVVERLVQDIFGETVFSFINDALGPELSEFHCQLPAGRGTSRLGVSLPRGMSAAATRQQRDQWSQQNAAMLQTALAGLVQNGRGQAATPEEMQRFLQAIDGWEPAQIRRALEAARDQGGINIDRALQQTEAGPQGGGTPPMTPEEVRLPPRRRVTAPLERLESGDVVQSSASPCPGLRVCRTVTLPSGPLSGVDIELVPVETFEAFLRGRSRSDIQDMLEGTGGRTPVLPPTPDQPVPSVPILRVRFPLAE